MNKQRFYDQGRADHAKPGCGFARDRMAKYTGWQGQAYRDGFRHAQEVQDGHHTPAAIWMRTPHAERLALLHDAKLAAYLAGKPFADMRQAAQESLTVAMGDAVEYPAKQEKTPAEHRSETIALFTARVNDGRELLDSIENGPVSDVFVLRQETGNICLRFDIENGYCTTAHPATPHTATTFTDEADALRIARRTTNGYNENPRPVRLSQALADDIATMEHLITTLRALLDR